MKKHLLGFGLFTLIVGVTVFAAAYYFNLTKPIPEIPVVNLNTKGNYSCKYKQVNAGNSVVVDLEAKKLFVNAEMPKSFADAKDVSVAVEIYGDQEAISVVFAKGDEVSGSQINGNSLNAELNCDSCNRFSPRKNYYATVTVYQFFDSRHLSSAKTVVARNVPVTISAGKRNY